MTTLHSRKSIDPSPLRLGFVIGALALGCLALLPRAQAVLPTPDGDYSTGDTAQGLGDNTAIGADELCNMMMRGNTPYGCHALEGNTMGKNNTAIGFNALEGNTMGNSNTAIGFNALENNAMGNSNTAIGFNALENNAMGNNNTAIGLNALENNAMGINNTAIGFAALYRSTGSHNIALGERAGAYKIAGDHNIYIGNAGIESEAGQIRIGGGLQTGTYIAGIRNAAVTGSPVVIGMGGKLGVTMSSAQFKEAIKPMDKASEAILALKPVTFYYKKAVDPDGIAQFGLVAEQVEQVNPDLVARDEEGKVYTVRYDAINAMLLNEFLKEHKKVEAQNRRIQEQEATITQLKKEMQVFAASLKEQAAQLQKVSAQLEVSKPARQVVNNP